MADDTSKPRKHDHDPSKAIGSMSDKARSGAILDSKDPPQSAQDQSPNSVVRAYDVADRAEEAAVRPLAGVPEVDPLTSGDRLHDASDETEEGARRTAERTTKK